MISKDQKRKRTVLHLSNIILIKEFESGALSIEKDENKRIGHYQTLDRDTTQSEGAQIDFFIKGLPQLISSITYTSFESHTNYLSLGKNFGGPEWLWIQFNNRLKLGVYDVGDKLYINLKMPKLKLGSSLEFTSRFTWQNIDFDNFDDDIQLPNSLNFLNQNGIDIGLKSVFLKEPQKRDGYIAIWDKENDLAFGLIYFVIAFFPLYLTSQKFKTPKIRIIDDLKISRETMFYDLNELLSSGEKDTIECKSSAYFSYNKKIPPTKLNDEIIRTIVGMLNAKGGTLLIGVSEDQKSKDYKLKGIKSDYEWMEYADEDLSWSKKMGKLTGTWEDYQKVIRKELMDKVGRTFFNTCIMINFEDIGEGKNNPVCRIDIEPAPQPVSDEKGLKHIRFANGTQLLPRLQEDEYFRNRFPHLENIEKDVNKI